LAVDHDILCLMMKLKFGDANTKLVKLQTALKLKVITFSLPSGFTCPGALDCLSRANRQTGHITDGPNTKFRCFQASAEALYPQLRNMVWANFEAIKAQNGNTAAITKLIQDSLPAKFDVCRVHVGGDFFNGSYFEAWLQVARDNPSKLFYAYTKELRTWVKNLGFIPTNFVLTASRGGKFDSLIDTYNLKNAVVVFSEKEATDKGLEIDHSDEKAAVGTKNFALLLHGVMPAGTPAAKALQAIKAAAKSAAKSLSTI